MLRYVIAMGITLLLASCYHPVPKPGGLSIDRPGQAAVSVYPGQS